MTLSPARSVAEMPALEPVEETPRLSPAWTTWIARNLLRGVEASELLVVLTKRGVKWTEAKAAVEAVEMHPIYAGALTLSKRLTTTEIVLNIKAEMLRQSMSSFGIERRCKLNAEEFFRDYYSANKPVVITDLVQQWPAYSKWNLDYLKREYGDFEVEIQAHRKSDPVYEVFLKGHNIKMTFKEFLDRCVQPAPSNEFYLTANDRVLDNPNFVGLLDDFWPSEGMFNPVNRTGKQFLWIGSAGVVSPLHRDRLNVFMSQIIGRKKVIMIDSAQTHLMYNFESFFSEVDAENPNLAKFPEFGHARPLEIVLEAGEALFIPVGWWHHIRALEFSVNVSLTNFAQNNDFEPIYDRTTVSL
jgi:hypothetical protein